MNFFHPTTGEAARSFSQIWRVVQYELGVSAYRTGLTLADGHCKEYRQGWEDAAAKDRGRSPQKPREGSQK